jgi:hypothetical protein
VVRSAVFCATVVAATLSPEVSAAQGEYRNTAPRRPIQIEDAYANDRHALDLHISPIVVGHLPGQSGILPRTQVDLSMPIAIAHTGSEGVGIAGLELSALYNLNTETGGLPALALRAGSVIPAGHFGPERLHPAARAIATRTVRGMRLHANLEYTWGDEPGDSLGPGLNRHSADLRRWIAGVAIDRTLPLRAILLTAEAYASAPVDNDHRTQWTSALGLRYQMTPTVTLDAAAGSRIRGPNSGWFFTLGAGRTTGVKALVPGLGRWGR